MGASGARGGAVAAAAGVAVAEGRGGSPRRLPPRTPAAPANVSDPPAGPQDRAAARRRGPRRPRGPGRRGDDDGRARDRDGSGRVAGGAVVIEDRGAGSSASVGSTVDDGRLEGGPGTDGAMAGSEAWVGATRGGGGTAAVREARTAGGGTHFAVATPGGARGRSTRSTEAFGRTRFARSRRSEAVALGTGRGGRGRGRRDLGPTGASGEQRLAVPASRQERRTGQDVLRAQTALHRRLEQAAPQGARVLGAVGGPLGEVPHDRVGDGVGDVGSPRDALQGRRRVVDLLDEQRHGLVAGERRPAGAHLVDHRRDRIHVALRADLLSGRALRRDVTSGPEDEPRGRRHRGIGPAEARDAEVEDLDELTGPLAFDEHDVLGLQITVDDPALVRRAGCLAELHARCAACAARSARRHPPRGRSGATSRRGTP